MFFKTYTHAVMLHECLALKRVGGLVEFASLGSHFGFLTRWQPFWSKNIEVTE